MKELAEALPAIAFWCCVALWIWVSHVQYMAGHESSLFEHKTSEEIRIREATIQILEAKAKKEKTP